MVFSSTIFLFLFLPIVLIGYYLINTKYRNGFLAIASLFFYAWGENKLVLLMIFSIALNFLGGIFIAYLRSKKGKRLSMYSLWLFVIINVLILIYFKYANFFEESLEQFGILKESSLARIILPIGISFFTFQGMSYLIDVYYEKVKPQKNVISLGLYISMFPQLIAGPIVRYIDVEKQIREKRVFDWRKFSVGVERFIIGLFKKVIIANQVGFIADYVFNNSDNLGAMSHWLGILCYSLQIYFDFSGYSDMAIGLGKMFGFDFLENFNYPYISRSIKEFWRRWHISLSTWFRDYLYLPLGGNRRGSFRTYLNLLIVFFVTGLWHGANWTFIVWGLYHGFFLIIERLGFEKALTKLPSLLMHIYTLIIVLIGWVFFRADTLEGGISYLSVMFSFTEMGNNYLLQQFISPYFIIVLIVGLLLSVNIKGMVANFLRLIISPKNVRLLKYTLYVFIFIFCLMELATNNYNPFIYFRF